MSGESQFQLTGKRALVTGGNTGIGLAIARALAQAGATVAIAGRSESRNGDALAELENVRPGCRSFVFDLEHTDGIEHFYSIASEAVGGIDILVNNAGTTVRERADLVGMGDLDRIVKVNLTAPYVLSQCFGRERIERQAGGCIIMIASLMSEAARPGTSAYTMTKGGIRQLVKALAVDWAQFGIRVNGIGPGYIRTEMTRPLAEDARFDAWVRSRTPLGRWGAPSDVASAAVFLASEAASFVTGQVLYVDGGWLATF